MAKPLTRETIQKIREEVLDGKSKYLVAKEMGIGKTTLYRHTNDIPNKRQRHTLKKETIAKIREEVFKGKTKFQIAKDLNKAGGGFCSI